MIKIPPNSKIALSTVCGYKNITIMQGDKNNQDVTGLVVVPKVPRLVAACLKGLGTSLGP
jgi:hypothetical protein